MRDGMTICEAARACGLTAKAIRLYEARGLLGPTRRSAAGYRLYTPADLEELRFIRSARALGQRQAEIRQVLDVRRGGVTPCASVRELLDRHITEINGTIHGLQELRSILTAVQATAEQAPPPGSGATDVICPVIERRG